MLFYICLCTCDPGTPCSAAVHVHPAIGYWFKQMIKTLTLSVVPFFNARLTNVSHATSTSPFTRNDVRAMSITSWYLHNIEKNRKTIIEKTTLALLMSAHGEKHKSNKSTTNASAQAWYLDTWDRDGKSRIPPTCSMK